MPTILFRDGPLDGRRIRVSSEIVIGREGADLSIDDQQVSRHHVRLRPVDGGLEVEDLASTNGSWLNGNQIAGATQMRPGDVLAIGGTSIELEADVEFPASPPAAPTPPPTAAAAFPLPSGARDGRSSMRPRIASRVLLPTALAFGAIVGTAVALVIYFALRS